MVPRIFLVVIFLIYQKQSFVPVIIILFQGVCMYLLGFLLKKKHFKMMPTSLWDMKALGNNPRCVSFDISVLLSSFVSALCFREIYCLFKIRM